VCPWNGAPIAPSDPSWTSRGALNVQSRIELWRGSVEGLAALVGVRALTRAGVRGLRRNVAVALGNSGDAHALAALDEDRPDPLVRDPVVAEHVEWAKARLRS
jgi:epoxyqueuosine reductase